MAIYDETTRKEISDPDLSAGYLYDGEIVTGRTEERVEVMDGTVTENRPNGLRVFIPSEDISKKCQFYHKYTEEEILSVKKEKLSNLSNSCNQTITSGTDVQLYGGITKHFTYSLEDQSNISNMYNAVLMGVTQFPYHAGSESCEIYSAKDIISIYATLSAFTTAQTTYHNMLKQYVESLKTVPEIQSVTYGQELTGEYLENYNEMLKVANEQMQVVLSKASEYSV